MLGLTVFNLTIVVLQLIMDLPTTEAVEGTPSYQVNCSNFTSIQFWYLDLARGVSGGISLLVCSLILFLILLHKAYATLLQRFLLYSTLATWLAEAAFTMQIEHLVKYAGQRQFCVAVAFLEQWTILMVIAIDLEISVLLTYRVYESLQKQVLNCSSWSKCVKVSIEITTVCLSVFVPLVGAVVPLIHGTYGLTGGWCWITDIHNKCKKHDEWVLFTVLAILYIGGGLLIGICIAFVVILFCMSTLRSSNSHPLNCRLIRNNLVLLAFYLAYFAFSSIGVSTQLHSSTTHDENDKYPLWLVYAIGFPFNKLTLLLGFLFYMYSFKKLTIQTFRILKRICCKCYHHCTQRICHTKDDAPSPRQGFRSVTGGPTYRSSHPQVYPSETVFSPPYTGAFTSITRRDSSDEGERKQLIPSPNIGYGSFHGNIQYELQRTC